MKHGTGYYHLLAYMVIYFFFNGFLLPEGLLYTTLLSPVMLYFLYKHRPSSPSPAWILLLLAPVPFHWIDGVDAHTYLISSTLVLTAFIFLVTAIIVLRKFEVVIPDLFRTVLIINTLLTAIALITLPFEPVRGWLWYLVPFSKGIEAMPRLKLFTYEASYYALIMAPVFMYFLYRVMFEKEKHPMIVSLACILPLLFSLSFGVLGAIIIAMIITLAVYRGNLPVLFRRISLYTGIMALATLVIVLLVWRENPVFMRIGNIYHGKDTSAMGRLYYAFIFAKEMAMDHNWLFGVGPGQVKILAHDLIVNHYKYHGTVAETVRIPNAMGEMLATYGMYGLAVKILLELYFFVRKRIYGNVYAFTLFTFLVVYQFTGSFLVNVAELGAWALIFSIRFPEFEIMGNHGGKEQRA